SAAILLGGRVRSPDFHDAGRGAAPAFSSGLARRKRDESEGPRPLDWRGRARRRKVMIRAVFRHAPKARGDASNQNENRNRQEPARVQSARQASLPMTQTTDKSRDPRAQRVAGGEAALPQALMNALDALGIGAYAKDGAGRYLQLNASAQELLGVNESD